MAPCKGVLRKAELELPDSLNEGHGLDVTDSSAELDHADLRPEAAAVHGPLGYAVQPLDYGTRDVGHDLHGLAQVLTTTLLLDHVVVNLASGDIVISEQGEEHHPLVIAQVQVRFPAVVEDEDLTVLVRAHQAGVDIDVWVHLDGRDAHSVPSQQRPYGGRGHALAQRAADASGDDDILRALLHRGSEGRRGRGRGRDHTCFQELVEVVRRRRRHRRQLHAGRLGRRLAGPLGGRLPVSLPRGWLRHHPRLQHRAARTQQRAGPAIGRNGRVREGAY
mmetsp:Transcript_41264/g.119331  ORF Transcript_41264/g.119331 Transcript_41264/m.119331 type:complete len:277 (-) Transcript_41264:12-842(-)